MSPRQCSFFISKQAVACQIGICICCLGGKILLCFRNSYLCISNVNVARRNDISIVSNIFQLTVNGICNTCKKVDQSLCNFSVGCFQIENNGAITQQIIRNFRYVRKGFKKAPRRPQVFCLRSRPSCRVLPLCWDMAAAHLSQDPWRTRIRKDGDIHE